MPDHGHPPNYGGRGIIQDFQTTHWSIVLAAGRDRQTDSSTRALESLCATYWVPVYGFIRHRVCDEHKAQDLTQTFFQQLLERQTLGNADPERGRFRSFLLTACKRFLLNASERDRALKRGGGQQILSLDFDSVESGGLIKSADGDSPEQLYERQWAVAMLDSVLQTLRHEYVSRGNERQFEVLKHFIAGPGQVNYANAADQLQITEGGIKVAVHRLRSRYRDLIRAEIAQTVASADDAEDEVRRLFQTMAPNSKNSV